MNFQKETNFNHTKDIKLAHYTHFCSDDLSLIKTLKIVNKSFPYSFKWKYIYNEVDDLNTVTEQLPIPNNINKRKIITLSSDVFAKQVQIIIIKIK